MDIRKRLETDLKEVVGRLRQMGGSAALEELLGPGEHWAYADEVDEIQANERREIGFATRELLVERVNRITAALDRLNDGEYGTCVECGEKIAAARLDRKSTRLNSSHLVISYAVFCLKKKNKILAK